MYVINICFLSFLENAYLNSTFGNELDAATKENYMKIANALYFDDVEKLTKLILKDKGKGRCSAYYLNDQSSQSRKSSQASVLRFPCIVVLKGHTFGLV